MGEFLMPSLGADMEAGKLVEWEKALGDVVHRGDIIAVVETQKGAIEIEVFEDGVLEEYLVEIGKKVPVGTPLATISGDNAVANAAPPDKPSLPQEPVTAGVQVSQVPATRLRVSPAARKRAREAGIDLMEVAGASAGGAVSLQDVNAYIDAQRQPELPKPQAARPSHAGDKSAPAQMAGMRSAIAAAMARSKREIPHYYLSQTVDLSRAEAFVRTTNKNREPGERLVLGALYLKAVALALDRFAEFNGHYSDGNYQPVEAVHAGMAINIRGGGLVAPAIHNTRDLSLDQLMQNMTDLVARVRAGRFRAAELSDPTITVSSLGERGVESLYGVIYPPQVAILGFGTPSERAVNEGGSIGWQTSVVVTLAGDHRVSDGHRGARFLRAVEKHLVNPEDL